MNTTQNLLGKLQDQLQFSEKVSAARLARIEELEAALRFIYLRTSMDAAIQERIAAALKVQQ